ncbi:hypothetical protein SAMN04488515_1355 [Cognatiyoonia koreensis]|uniref:Uncharacterized protein n=1 Tax=Cognatiyoonia koreensis TaxID=364200 RepID=A0A1I0PQ02_9RHOB|nr:hypothetical protein [Cognatiyoonia koreensis]SEW16456.1 hypothetical protein SAMN04488515_1355 [Cognatiyoonia koreensis]
MFRLLKRQRRRLTLYALFVAFPIAIAVISMMLGSQIGVGGMQWRLDLIAGLAAWAMTMGLPIAILYFVPDTRFLLDLLAATFTITVWPQAAASLISQEAAFATSAIACVLIIACVRFDLIDKLMPRRDFFGQATYRTQQSPYAIWAEHVPDPGLLDRHWCPALQSTTFDRKNANLRTSTYHFDFLQYRQRQMMTQFDMHEAFSYDFETIDDDNQTIHRGTFSLQIIEHGRYRDVRIKESQQKLRFTDWLVNWMDDSVGDQADHLMARAQNMEDRSVTGDLMRSAAVAHPSPNPAAA